MGLESVSGAASDRPGGAGEAAAAAAATPAGTKASQLIPLHLKDGPRTSLAILETFWERDVKEIDDFFFDANWLMWKVDRKERDMIELDVDCFVVLPS